MEKEGKLYLIVGLGNPGIEYRETRHNVGFMVIEKWASELKIPLRENGIARYGMVQFGDKRVILQCPLTYMNLSGRAVKLYKERYGVMNENIMVVHDDLDLPLGRLRVARDGGSGGHKGVDSIIESLNSKEFPRLRIGIGRPRYGEPIVEYVLSSFYEDEVEVVQKVIELAVEGCELFVSKGIEYAMNKINPQNLVKGGE
ncbi:MAG: aminoacyl-tRNA hydrolase [Deltaproteobacteria bacterium]|nr:MAG: aminoacyl-tRNA hydrolase [Deltaproteobacteria bacterium]